MGAGPESVDYDLFLEAVRTYDVDQVSRFSREGLDPNRPAGPDMFSAMTTIGSWGCYDPAAAGAMLRLLVAHGGDVNTSSPYPNEYTPLMFALDSLAIDGLQEDRKRPNELDWSFVESLLEAGADPTLEVRGRDGQSCDAFDVAASWGPDFLAEFRRIAGPDGATA